MVGINTIMMTSPNGYIFRVTDALNENDRIPIRISLKFVPRDLINNKSALVQIMAWRLSGDKPFSESMLTQFINAYMRHLEEMS